MVATGMAETIIMDWDGMFIPYSVSKILLKCVRIQQSSELDKKSTHVSAATSHNSH